MTDPKVTQSTKLIDSLRAGKQDLGQGVTVELIEDGHIFLFDVVGFTRKTVDVWADAVIQVAGEATDQPVLMLHDLRKTGISSHSRKRSQDIMDYVKENNISASYAAVVGNDIVGQAIRVFANTLSNLINRDGIQGKVFNNQEDALNYLRQFLIH